MESSELLELFLWKEHEEVDPQKIKRELADVLYSALLLADFYRFDVKDIILEKLAENEAKYPLDIFKGSNKKYDEV